MAAETISRLNYQIKAFHVLISFFCLMLCFQKGNATQFTVGGDKGWTVSDNASAYNYNQWAERTRFQIGDSLLFVYKPDQDSVLQVTKEDYDNCTTTAALTTFNDGHTVFTFNRSGPFYFISGNKENCLKNEKLVVIVLADRSNHSSNTNETIPAPSPAPAGEAPPTGTVEINPTPSPAGQPPSAASSTFISFIGSIAALFASSLILVF